VVAGGGLSSWLREAVVRLGLWCAKSESGKKLPLYEVKSLYLAASEESKAKLLFDFHAYPFREPATNLLQVRDRWIDAATGTFLTPHAYGAIDSSNAYAGFAIDPMNNADPTGQCISLDSVNCSDYLVNEVDQFSNPLNWQHEAVRALRRVRIKRCRAHYSSYE
jgi:hypothetical protein